MAMISEKDKETIRKKFEEIKNSVKLINFTQQIECEYYEDTRKIMEEISKLSDKISLEIYNFQLDKQKAEVYKIDKILATIIFCLKDYGIRYYGIPAGYEFTSLIEDIIDVSKGEPGLSQETIDKLNQIQKDVHLQVFVTPTCPYCPNAVRLAHKFAIATDKITADMVEAIEFPHLSVKYNVRGVPKTVINEEYSVEGAVPENILIEKILEAVK